MWTAASGRGGEAWSWTTSPQERPFFQNLDVLWTSSPQPSPLSDPHTHRDAQVKKSFFYFFFDSCEFIFIYCFIHSVAAMRGLLKQSKNLFGAHPTTPPWFVSDRFYFALVAASEA